jgi:hypothetical protein
MRVTLSASIARTCSSSICAIRFAMVMTSMGTWEARRHTSAFVDRPSDTPRPSATRTSWPSDFQAHAPREGMSSG